MRVVEQPPPLTAHFVTPQVACREGSGIKLTMSGQAKYTISYIITSSVLCVVYAWAYAYGVLGGRRQTEEGYILCMLVL